MSDKRFIANPVSPLVDPQDRRVAGEQAAGFDFFRRLNRQPSLPAEVVVEHEGSWINSRRNPKN